LGCSLGGRQGFKAAEMFPSDFDGIVAGSPALDFNNLASWRASFFPITGSLNSADFITTSTWTNLIHSEILRQCDGLDGVLDGIIEDPGLCNFMPEALMCNENTATECLTSVQVEMVRKVFSPFYGEDGKLIYPAMQPGSEGMAVNKLYAGKPFSYSEVFDLPNISLFPVHAKDIRTGSETLSTTTPRGILPLSQSTTPPQLNYLIHRISGPGPVTSPRFAMHPGKSSATMVVKITKSQASIPSVSTTTFRAACKLPQ
jgi:hypothetical protein